MKACVQTVTVSFYWIKTLSLFLNLYFRLISHSFESSNLFSITSRFMLFVTNIIYFKNKIKNLKKRPSGVTWLTISCWRKTIFIYNTNYNNYPLQFEVWFLIFALMHSTPACSSVIMNSFLVILNATDVIIDKGLLGNRKVPPYPSSLKINWDLHNSPCALFFLHQYGGRLKINKMTPKNWSEVKLKEYKMSIIWN